MLNRPVHLKITWRQNELIGNNYFPVEKAIQLHSINNKPVGDIFFDFLKTLVYNNNVNHINIKNMTDEDYENERP